MRNVPDLPVSLPLSFSIIFLCKNLLFELLFGAKKGISKLPDGVKWLNANRKREHLYSGAMRRYAKEDHGKALKDADVIRTGSSSPKLLWKLLLKVLIAISVLGVILYLIF